MWDPRGEQEFQEELIENWDKSGEVPLEEKDGTN